MRKSKPLSPRQKRKRQRKLFHRLKIDIDSPTEDDILAIAKEKELILSRRNSAWAAQRRKIKELEAQLDAEKAANGTLPFVANTAEDQLKQVEANVKLESQAHS